MLDELVARFDPTRSAVVVIDVQNDYCSPSGQLAQRGRNFAGIDEVVTNIESLIASARTHDVAVCFVSMAQVTHEDNAIWARRRPHRLTASSEGAACEAGTWGAGHYRISPRPGDIQIEKHRYSAFIGTPLERELRSRSLDSLLFCGVSTNVCVESSLRDAVCRDFFTTLVEDCCGSHDRADHRRAVESVRADFGLVTTSSDIFTHWARLVKMTGVPRDTAKSTRR